MPNAPFLFIIVQQIPGRGTFSLVEAYMARRTTSRSTLYLAHVPVGVESVARQEIVERLPDTEFQPGAERVDERTNLLLFRSAAPPAELLRLRTVEDVFAVVAESDSVPAQRSGLAAIRGLLAGATGLERAAGLAQAVRPRRGKPTYRVIARKAGEHAYRRVDVQRAAEAGIGQRHDGWRLVEDDAGIEVWVQLIGPRFIAAVRLSTNEMRQRTYRAVSLPAALKPTIAAAMIRLTEPDDDDVFLDPMCGSGTILIERALAGRYRRLLGGDRDPAAVAATLANVGPRYQPIEIRQWNAAQLPLPDASVSALACNLPFGKQIGSPEENRDLYPALLAEWTRVVQQGGRLALLTSERRLLARSLEQAPLLVRGRQLNVLVRGLPAVIVSLRRA